MAHPLARLAALVALLGAACSAPAPVPSEPPSELLRSFHDPFGRSPASLRLGAGTHLRIAYVDSLFLSRSPAEREEEARTIARYLWAAFAGSRGVDTVSVAFTNRARAGAARAEKTTQTFLFYPDQLREPRERPAGSPVP